MTRTALLQVTHHAFQRDYRKGLLTAAAAAGDIALHIQCGNARVLTEVTHGVVTENSWSQLSALEDDLKQRLGQAKVIVLTGVGGAFAPEVEQVARLFPRRRRFYDVQDDLSYGTKGFAYLKYLGRDWRWRRLCGETVVLELGMKRFYPRAHHLDNASHIVSDHRSAPPVRTVYIGSIDHRLDLDLLGALAEQTPIDIFGGLHESAQDLRPQLDAMVNGYGKLRLLGPYHNDQLAELLQPYSIGLVPYHTGHRLTEHVNPDKIYHYLNAGLGVVSTAIPQARRMGEHIALLERPEQFQQAAEIALCIRRGWRAEAHHWDGRWSAFKGLIADTVASKS